MCVCVSKMAARSGARALESISDGRTAIHCCPVSAGGGNESLAASGRQHTSSLLRQSVDFFVSLCQKNSFLVLDWIYIYTLSIAD